jgi:hypothetical protein
MVVDMWYNDKISDVDKITWGFYDLDCQYRGNMYINNKCVGDFSTPDSLAIQQTFPQLKIVWD